MRELESLILAYHSMKEEKLSMVCEMQIGTMNYKICRFFLNVN